MKLMSKNPLFRSGEENNKNLAIANTSRVSCAHNTLRAFILHRDLEM